MGTQNGGLWNNSPTATPGGTGGITIGTYQMTPVIGFGGVPAGSIGDNATANFGQSAFRDPAPAGFLNWMAG